MEEQNSGKYKVIFVIGPPGAGKNTQCDNLIKTYGFIHFGAGDLLRGEAKKDTEEGIKIREIINQGKIVPTVITCGLIKKKMDECGKDKIFLIDGYPRNIENFEGVIEVFGDQIEIVCTLHLTCDDETCVKRLLNRRQSSGRADDDEAVIKKRFHVFYNESMPVVEILKKNGPMIEVDSTKSPEEVTTLVIEAFDKLLGKTE